MADSTGEAFLRSAYVEEDAPVHHRGSIAPHARADAADRQGTYCSTDDAHADADARGRQHRGSITTFPNFIHDRRSCRNVDWPRTAPLQEAGTLKFAY